MAELLILNGASAGTAFVLADVPTVVGRSEEAHLLVADPWISSMHAMFERRGDEIWVVDLDSRNGTFVGDERISEARLVDGAIVRFGRTEVRIDFKRAPRSAQTPEPARAPRDAHRDTVRADHTLSSRAPVTVPDADAPPHDLAARRATVLRMAVDAAGIDGLAGAQERLRAAIDAAAQAAADAGAAVSRLAGIGVLAVFGIDEAGPDDAKRAVAAALAARRAVRVQGGLELRAAVETGPVLAATAPGGFTLTALGPAAELAERLLALAGRGEILAGPEAGPAAGLEPAGVRTVGELQVDVFRPEG